MLDTRGVFRFVAFEGKSVVMLDKEIEQIKKIATSSRLLVENEWIEGDLVGIADGPFAGLQGMLIQKQVRSRLL